MITLRSDVTLPLLMCHVYMEVRIKRSASLCLSTFVLKLICISSCLLWGWLAISVFPHLKRLTHYLTLLASMQPSPLARWSRECESDVGISSLTRNDVQHFSRIICPRRHFVKLKYDRVMGAGNWIFIVMWNDRWNQLSYIAPCNIAWRNICVFFTFSNVRRRFIQVHSYLRTVSHMCWCLFLVCSIYVIWQPYYTEYFEVLCCRYVHLLMLKISR